MAGEAGEALPYGLFDMRIGVAQVGQVPVPGVEAMGAIIGPDERWEGIVDLDTVELHAPECRSHPSPDSAPIEQARPTAEERVCGDRQPVLSVDGVHRFLGA